MDDLGAALALVETFNDRMHLFDRLSDGQVFGNGDHSGHRLACRHALVGKLWHGLQIVGDQHPVILRRPGQQMAGL